MWYQFCENPLALTNLFAADPADHPVEIHGVRLARDGARVQLQIELPTFPERPHPRWEAGANTLQVEVDLWGVTDFEMAGWGTDNVGTFTLEGGQPMRFTFASKQARFSGRCSMARIGRVSAYLDERKEAP